MIHIEDVDKIDEKYFAEFKTKSFYEIVEKYRTDKQLAKK